MVVDTTFLFDEVVVGTTFLFDEVVVDTTFFLSKHVFTLKGDFFWPVDEAGWCFVHGLEECHTAVDEAGVVLRPRQTN